MSIRKFRKLSCLNSYKFFRILHDLYIGACCDGPDEESVAKRINKAEEQIKAYINKKIDDIHLGDLADEIKDAIWEDK